MSQYFGIEQGCSNPGELRIGINSEPIWLPLYVWLMLL